MQSPRPDPHRPIGYLPSAGGPACRHTGPASRAPERRGGAYSSELSFYERDFPNLFVMNRAMPEKSIFSEEFSVIGGDGDVGVFRYEIEQFFDYAIQVLHGADLPLAQCFELLAIKEFFSLLQLAAHHVIVQMFKHAVYA